MRLAPSPSARWRSAQGRIWAAMAEATSALAAALKVAAEGRAGPRRLGRRVGGDALEEIVADPRCARGGARRSGAVGGTSDDALDRGAGWRRGRALRRGRDRRRGRRGHRRGGRLDRLGLADLGRLARRRRGGDRLRRCSGERDLVDQLDLHRRRLGRGVDAREVDRQRDDQRDVERQRGPGPGKLGAAHAHGVSPPTETSATRLRPARLSSPSTRMTRPWSRPLSARR